MLATCNQPTKNHPPYLNASRIGIAEGSPGTGAVVVVVAPVIEGEGQSHFHAILRTELAHSQLEGPSAPHPVYDCMY